LRTHKLRNATWIVVVLALLAVIFHAAILTAAARYLVLAGPPEKSDVAIVLGGDGFGNRIVKAGELVREGYAPKVLVSGPAGIYGFHEDQLAIPFAEKAGYSASYFLGFPNESRSTQEEAYAIVPELRRLGVHTILLVTSDYHTRRAGRIYRKAAPDLEFHVVAAPDKYFTPDGWWKNREARKIFVIEWMKTVAEWVGL
jgi:uncharacterized SAM-binding protein YcdF (DUF218 family)